MKASWHGAGSESVQMVVDALGGRAFAQGGGLTEEAIALASHIRYILRTGGIAKLDMANPESPVVTEVIPGVTGP